MKKNTVEIALMLSLGGALFAALTVSAICAKEEEGHTAEFINTLPVSRSSIFVQKYGAMVSLLVLFEVINILLILAGLLCRVLPDLGKVKYITPYYYANAADIVAKGSVSPVMVGTGMTVCVCSFLLALLIYNKRDIIV